MLIVDHKSTDDSAQIAGKYPFARWISFQQPGIYEAMNRGVQESSGTYIWFLGADDRLYSHDTLAKVAECLPGKEILIGDVLNYPSENRISYHGFQPKSLVDRPICHQALVCHRSIFTRAGLFETKYRLAADYAFEIKAFGLENLNFGYLNEVLVKYDERGASAVALDIPFLRNKHLLVARHLKTQQNGKANDYRQIGRLGLQMLHLRKYRKAFTAIGLAAIQSGNTWHYIREVLAYFKNR